MCMFLFGQSDEEIYEKECGNMPGFSVFYRDPNSARVNFGQYIRVRSVSSMSFYDFRFAVHSSTATILLCCEFHQWDTFCLYGR